MASPHPARAPLGEEEPCPIEPREAWQVVTEREEEEEETDAQREARHLDQVLAAALPPEDPASPEAPAALAGRDPSLLYFSDNKAPGWYERRIAEMHAIDAKRRAEAEKTLAALTPAERHQLTTPVAAPCEAPAPPPLPLDESAVVPLDVFHQVIVPLLGRKQDQWSRTFSMDPLPTADPLFKWKEDPRAPSVAHLAHMQRTYRISDKEVHRLLQGNQGRSLASFNGLPVLSNHPPGTKHPTEQVGTLRVQGSQLLVDFTQDPNWDRGFWAGRSLNKGAPLDPGAIYTNPDETRRMITGEVEQAIVDLFGVPPPSNDPDNVGFRALLSNTASTTKSTAFAPPRGQKDDDRIAVATSYHRRPPHLCPVSGCAACRFEDSFVDRARQAKVDAIMAAQSEAPRGQKKGGDSTSGLLSSNHTWNTKTCPVPNCEGCRLQTKWRTNDRMAKIDAIMASNPELRRDPHWTTTTDAQGREVHHALDPNGGGAASCLSMVPMRKTKKGGAVITGLHCMTAPATMERVHLRHTAAYLDTVGPSARRSGKTCTFTDASSWKKRNQAPPKRCGKPVVAGLGKPFCTTHAAYALLEE